MSTSRGGWYWRVVSIEDENGWLRGYWPQLSGLDAFMEAMGLDPVDEGDIGPFDSECYPRGDLEWAYRALLTRMLACLVIVSRAALASNREAAGRIEEQQARFEELRAASLADLDLSLYSSRRKEFVLVQLSAGAEVLIRPCRGCPRLLLGAWRCPPTLRWPRRLRSLLRERGDAQQ